MTQEEGNKLIAVFDGWEVGRFEHLPNILHKMDNGKLWGIDIDQMNYHEDWNKLMPVVEKIENIRDDRGNYLFAVDIGRDYCTTYHNDFHTKTISVHSETHNKIISTWNAITQFIQWYNTTKK